MTTRCQQIFESKRRVRCEWFLWAVPAGRVHSSTTGRALCVEPGWRVRGAETEDGFHILRVSMRTRH